MTTQRELLADGFDQPQVVSDLNLTFGTGIAKLLPPYSIIPAEFKQGAGRWVRFQRAWFFEGFPKSGLVRRADVDADVAFRHLANIQRSFEPKHEHKEAAVAWLASRWFESIVGDTA